MQNFRISAPGSGVPLTALDNIIPFAGKRESGRDVCSCAGFRLPAMTNLSTRSGGRRPKSAKARNRGQWCSGGAAGAMGIWPRGMA